MIEVGEVYTWRNWGLCLIGLTQLEVLICATDGEEYFGVDPNGTVFICDAIDLEPLE